MSRKIDMLLDQAISLIPLEKPLDLPDGRLNSPQWHQYEREMWGIGEQIRQIRFTDSTMRLSDDQIEKVISIINHSFANRGRQSFIWLLGTRKYAYLAPRIIDQVYDDTVSLHIFDTIYKMRAIGYEKEVMDFQERFQPLSPDRKKIKRYLSAFHQN